MTEIVQFPQPTKQLSEWLIGPFEEYRVMVDGRIIPGLTGYQDGDRIALVLDHRFSVSLPESDARSVAWLVANALAIGQGYSHAGAENKDMPFAPRGHALASLPTD